jgi:site-specific recombinase XerD
VKKSLHTFRHQFISDALEAGISLRLVQKISGHVTLAVLQKYWHVDEDKYNEIRRLYD